MPHMASTASSERAGAPKRRPAAIALDPDSAMAAIVERRAAEPVGQRAGDDAADAAGRHDTEGDRARASGGRAAAERKARGEEYGDPRPHGVELPHVAQVADVGQADRWLGEGAACHAQAEARRRGGRTAPRAPRPSARTAATRQGMLLAATTTPASRSRASVPAARKACGDAEPMVIAPMIVPTARPRRRSNQPARTLSATG